MNKRTTQVLQLVLATVCLSIIQLNAGAQAIEQTLAAYADNYAQERAYLHYDKQTYAAGETVWFKAYLLEGISPVQNSKTLYVDWVDEAGAVLMHSVNPVVGGMTNGQFDIPVDFPGGFIQVRAYTRWMLNFDSSFLYSKHIRVLGKKSGATSKRIASIGELQFFAEGGDAIAGIKNKIAFKAADQWGAPVPVTGVVQNSSGATEATFAAQHNGMGFFYLEPRPGVTYSAKWKDAKGAEHNTPLPAVLNTGIAMQVDVQGVKRRFTLTRPGDAPDNLKQLHLVGTINQNLVFNTKVDLSARTDASGIIPTAALPSGILTITAFDSKWNAVAERITFINNNEYSFVPQLTVQHWGLSKRARNEIQIALPDSIEANFSVAVTDNAFASDSTDNIISRLLLTSDIKGFVYHPEYYFTATADSVQQQLDLVMLTHGWRRFKWESVVKGKLPAITHPKDTAYLSLSGKVYGIQPGSTANGSIVLFVKTKDSSSKMIMQAIGPDGSFNDPDAVFFDTIQVYHQLQPAKSFRGADVGFMLNRLPPLRLKDTALRVKARVPYDTTGDYRMQTLAQERATAGVLMKEKTLANVTVRSTAKTPVQAMDEKYTSGLFRGSDSYQFDLVNDPRAGGYPDIFTYLQGKVAGLQISPGAMGAPSLQWRGGAPVVLLNEINTDPGMLSSVPVSDIAYVKVFRPPFMGSFNGSNGAIAVYTRKGNDAPVTRSKGLGSNSVTGYTPEKQFYAPNYSRIDPRNEERDLRTTLYWNPDVQTSPGKRTITVTFYNNDITNAFRIIIEGMTPDGRLAHIEQVLE